MAEQDNKTQETKPQQAKTQAEAKQEMKPQQPASTSAKPQQTTGTVSKPQQTVTATAKPQQAASTVAKPQQTASSETKPQQPASATAKPKQEVNSDAKQAQPKEKVEAEKPSEADSEFNDIPEEDVPDILSDRQVAVLNHYIDIMGFTVADMQYIRSQQFMTDLFPVDIAIFAPIENFNYYVITTVGLSQYRFRKGFARCELCMVMPTTWKPIFGQKEYFWAVQILQDIAYNIVEENYGISIGQTHIFSGASKNEPYYECTDAVGGIICFPEMFPLEFLEEEIEFTYTRFLQVVTLNKSDLAKIDEVGEQDFITYDLHNADGPQMVIKVQEPKGIEKIIRKNEDTLKGN